MPLLDVRDLSIRYATRAGDRHAATDVSFTLDPGHYLGVVGESGCGKSTIVKALLGILPSNGRVHSGQVLFDGTDLARADESRLRQIRWRRISLVTQSAMNALDPVVSIGEQIVEAIRTHERGAVGAARARAEETFEMVGLDRSRLFDFPHQLSGGMRQRAMIAMALALDPDIVIGDEPTTGLDVIMQDQILHRLKRLQAEQHRAMMLVTHNIAAVTENCDRVLVMYAGDVMEYGATADVFLDSFNPYTLGLRNAFPSIRKTEVERSLISIPGAPPGLIEPGPGCRFAARCPFAEERCHAETPALVQVADAHVSRCHFPERVAEFRERSTLRATWEPEGTRQRQSWSTLAGNDAAVAEEHAPSLVVERLQTYFPVRQSLVGSVITRRRSHVHAVDGVSFELKRGRVIGLAGESGCGKTTTGMTIARLYEPTGGTIRLGDLDVGRLRSSGGRTRAFRRRVQVIFQDPYGSLNPRFTVEQTVEEVLKVHGIGNADERRARVLHALELVDLLPALDYVERYPHQLSGGQRQRVAIARAIALEPDFLIADEPVSMLDVSVQAGILNLLRTLVDELNIGLLYVTHDLSTMRHICDEVAIMYVGKVVEHGPTEEVLTRPQHPYAKALVAAVPVPDPRYRRDRVALQGEVPSAVDPPPGCRFASRCPQVMDVCRRETPALRVPPGGAQAVACYLFHDASEDGARDRRAVPAGSHA